MYTNVMSQAADNLNRNFVYKRHWSETYQHFQV